MKREKRLTKRERKAQSGGAGQDHHGHQHIHCTACGRHIEPTEFSAGPPTARIVACLHGSKFASCAACVTATQALLAEHDRTGQPVKSAGAWH